MEEKLHVNILGPVSFTLGGKRLHIKRRLPRSLLIYLAVEGGMISRSTLLTLFWPDIRESEGRKSLRETLSRLRAEIPDQILISDDDQIGVDSRFIEVDAHNFNRLVENISSKPISSPFDKAVDEETYQEMVTAVNLWKNTMVMAGYNLPGSGEFEEWALEIGHLYENILRYTLIRLMEHEIAIGKPELAIRWVQRALDIDRYDAELNLRLIQLLTNLGLDKEALNHCSYLKKAYIRDGYESLPPEIEVLFRKLEKRESQNVQEAVGIQLYTPVEQFLFTGRDRELTEFMEAVEQGGVVSISGPVGTGKTRLVFELLHAYKKPVRFFHLKPNKNVHSTLQNLIQMMGTSLHHRDLGMIEQKWRMYLAEIIPEMSLSPAEKVVVPAILPIDSQAHYNEVFYQVLHGISKMEKIFFLLDDAQWIDPLTAGFIENLNIRGLFENNLLAVCWQTGRRNHHLYELLENLKRENEKHTALSLGNLPVEVVEKILKSVFGKRFDEDFIQVVHKITDGNPRYVTELIHEINRKELEVKDPADLENSPLGKGFPSLLNERIAVLNDDCLNILFLAILYKQPFFLEMTANILEMEQKQVVEALERLEELKMIQPIYNAQKPGTYELKYDEIKLPLMEKMSAARKVYIHTRITDWLTKNDLTSGPYAESAAQHFQESGLYLQAFSSWKEAATWHAKNWENQPFYIAVQQADSLLEMIEKDVSDEDIHQIYTIWGDFADEMDDLPAGRKAFSRLLEFGQKRDSAYLIGSGFNGLSRVERRREAYRSSLEFLNQALFYLESTDEVFEKSRVYNRMAITLSYLNRLFESQEIMNKSMQLAKDNKSYKVQESVANTLMQIAQINMFRGWPARAYEMARNSIERYEGLTELLYVQVNQLTITHSCFLLGKFNEGYHLNRKTLRKVRMMNMIRLEMLSLIWMGKYELHEGKLDSCWRRLEQSKILQDQYKIQHSFEWFILMGDFHYFSGNMESAARNYISAGKEASESHQRLLSRMKENQVRLKQGDKSVLSKFVDIRDLAAENDFWSIKLQSEQLIAEYEAQQGLLPQAVGRIETVILESQRRNLVFYYLQCLLLYAEVMIQKGELDSARLYTNLCLQNLEEGYFWLQMKAYEILLRIAQAEQDGNKEEQFSESIMSKQEFLKLNSRQHPNRELFSV